MKTKPKRPAAGAKRGARTLAYPVEFRLPMVRLFLEEGYGTGLLREQFGASSHSTQRWVKAYRAHGAEGLEPKRPLGAKSRVPDEVRQQAVAVKKDHPEYGARRIAECAQAFLFNARPPCDGS
jgi:transposase-like protein